MSGLTRSLAISDAQAGVCAIFGTASRAERASRSRTFVERGQAAHPAGSDLVLHRTMRDDRCPVVIGG
jgi:hypothetical protein